MKRRMLAILLGAIMCMSGIGALAQSEADITWHGLYDVVVVGFGGAGASAAIEAADAGATVLLLEKAPEGHEGGNTRYAYQAVLMSTDGDQTRDYMKYIRDGYLTPSDEIIDAYVSGLTQVEGWLKDLGAQNVPVRAPLTPEFPEYEADAGLGVIFIDGEGFTSKFWKLLHENVVKRDIDIWYEAPGCALIQDGDGVILGVTALVDGREVNIRARNGVVLATGGFENNQQMVQDYLGLPYAYPMGSPYNTGDGIKMAMAVGADLWHMENMMGPYLNARIPGEDRTYAVQIQGAGLGLKSTIFVGADGTRFLDEATYLRHGYSELGGRFIHTPVSLPAYAIFDEAARLAGPIYGAFSADNSAEIEKGIIVQGETIEELAGKIGLDPAALAGTVAQYNGFCEAGSDPAFGRNPETLNALGDGPYYAMELVPSLINTQGGPRRNDKAEVLDTFGKPIPHLYSAGEMGSLYSNKYQGAGNLAECLIYGKIAGANAASVKAEQPADDLPIEAFAPSEAPDEVALGDGELLGVGTGIGGDIRVKVVMDGDAIREVVVLSHRETPGISDRALELIPEAIVAANSYEVDAIAGATLTSNGIMDAVKAALAS